MVVTRAHFLKTKHRIFMFMWNIPVHPWCLCLTELKIVQSRKMISTSLSLINTITMQVNTSQIYTFLSFTFESLSIGWWQKKLTFKQISQPFNLDRLYWVTNNVDNIKCVISFSCGFFRLNNHLTNGNVLGIVMRYPSLRPSSKWFPLGTANILWTV